MKYPFGIALGSTPNAWTTTYAVAFDSIPRAHPKFPVVLGRWSPDCGLWKIVGYSHIYENGSGGLDIRSDFEHLTQELEQNYGRCEELDYPECRKCSDPKMHLFAGGAIADPTSCVCWSRSSGARLPQGIRSICLMIEALVYPEARICLSYAARSDDFELEGIL